MMIVSRTTACGLVLAAAGLLAGVTGGCAGTTQQSSGELLERLDSARQISTAGPRDAATAQVARDAAESNQGDVSLQAVDAMPPSTLRDTTAEACAEKLNHLGRRDKAELMVNRIGNVATRDKIRAAYAAHAAPLGGT